MPTVYGDVPTSVGTTKRKYRCRRTGVWLYLGFANKVTYQSKAKKAMADGDCFKIYIYKKSCKITIGLLDIEGGENAEGSSKFSGSFLQCLNYRDKSRLNEIMRLLRNVKTDCTPERFT
ncbi:hypothetical protein QAD02_017615 [Eretmocerus hayati]|uniref:Uncharacterized protein n=1 Tax=Eretmocerus hayati TaxID=131215 RepID=A0ACC2PFI4_9HYME|nr:hypothetical protein QAD02_017615 [Eretmocerus hayati]